MSEKFDSFMLSVMAKISDLEVDLLDQKIRSIAGPGDARYDQDMSTPSKDEMKSALEASEARVDARLANFETSVKTGFAELRTSFAEVRTDMATQNGQIQTQLAEMRSEMHKGTIDIIKWVIGVGLASAGAMFSVSKMLEKPPVQAVTQPAPIIIAVPQAAAPVPVPAEILKPAPTPSTPK